MKRFLGAMLAVLLGACAAPQKAQPELFPAVQQVAVAAPEPLGGRQEAAQKFNALSRELEKVGADERLSPLHLTAQLQEMLRADPTYKPALYNLAVLQDEAGDSPQALETFRKLASGANPFVPAVENVLAMEAAADGEALAQSIAAYQRIVASDRTNLTSRLALARIYERQGRHHEAVALCREVLARQADAIEAFRILAVSTTATNNLPMAALIVSRGLRAAKEDVELTHTLAQIHLLKNDVGGGVDELKHVLRLDPSRLDVRAQLATIALAFRDFGNAAQQYEMILKQKPDLEAVKINLAVSYKGLGRFDQAEQVYKEVLVSHPAQPDVLWDLAVLYHRNLNRYDDAISCYRQYQQVTAAAPSASGAIHARQVDGLVHELEGLKSDQAAMLAQKEHEQKRQEAVQKVCASLDGAKVEDAGAVGSDQERIETAWQMMAGAQKAIEGGDVPAGEKAVKCAFVLLPKTAAANAAACAPMHVVWTQILYQLGRLEDASASNAATLRRRSRFQAVTATHRAASTGTAPIQATPTAAKSGNSTANASSTTPTQNPAGYSQDGSPAISAFSSVLSGVCRSGIRGAVTRSPSISTAVARR